MTPGSPLILPNELVLEIFALLSKDRSSLYNLLFICRSFRITVEKMLYEEMTDWLYSPPHDGFTSAVVKNPRLASYVRRFGCIERFGSVQDLGFSYENELSNRWRIFFTAIQKMSNLKFFIINLYAPMHLPPISEILWALKDKDLHTFIWGPSIYDTGATPELMSFLQNHLPSLRVLQMEASNEAAIQALGPTACPDIESIGGAWADIISIAMGRTKRVKSLSWFQSPWDDIPTNTNLTGALLRLLNGLEQLCLHHCFLGPLLSGSPEPSFPFFIDKCPNLRHIYVEADQILLNTHILHSAFPYLERLTLDISSGLDNKPSASSITSLFAACSTLQSIDIGPIEIYYHSGRPLDVVFMYERWLPIRKLDDAPSCEEQPTEPKVFAVSAGIVEADASCMFRYLPLFRVERKDRRHYKV